MRVAARALIKRPSADAGFSVDLAALPLASSPVCHGYDLNLALEATKADAVVPSGVAPTGAAATGDGR